MQISFYVHDVLIIIVYDYDKPCMFIYWYIAFKTKNTASFGEGNDVFAHTIYY